MFTYPTVDYSEANRTPERQRYSEIREYTQRLARDLADAQKSARRSPNKWLPVVARIEAVLAAAQVDLEAAEAVVDAQQKVASEARAQVLRDALEWAFAQVGPTELVEDHFLALRVRAADENRPDILIIEQSAHVLDILWVERGSQKVAERIGYIYRPDESWTRVTGPTTIQPSQISISSASKMTPEDALEFAATIRVASLVSSKINESFGIGD